jgi:hypothetical protein
MILCILVSSSGISLHLVRMATPNVIHLRSRVRGAEQLAEE